MRVRQALVSTMAIALAGIGIVKIVMVPATVPVEAAQDPPPDVLLLRGAVRDFRADHPDFDVPSGGERGHCSGHIDATLTTNGRPHFTGGGAQVVEQWFNRDRNPIAPYATDPGLPGGHFDVDVFDEATDRQLYHQHKYDDQYDVTYADLVQDSRLLMADILDDDAPTDLFLEFINPHNGSGTFVFEAGDTSLAGNTQDGLTVSYNRLELTQLRIDFSALSDLQRSNPGDVQRDVEDRNDAFAIRIYDAGSREVVYELAVYHHWRPGDDDGGYESGGLVGDDRCGVAYADEIGVLSGECNGSITSADSFSHWFRDRLGTNLSSVHTIALDRNFDGVYEYLADEFFPIDGRLLARGESGHNNFFTYAISAKFTYEECTGQFFEFGGNDDCWVFIDHGLVIDLGGVSTPERQYVGLDRLDLVEGEEYSLNFFYAHRSDDYGSSVFRMRTNLELRTTGSIPVSLGYD